jgi:hypothetical protein
MWRWWPLRPADWRGSFDRPDQPGALTLGAGDVDRPM